MAKVKFVLSPAQKLVFEDVKAWTVNLLKFTVPMFVSAYLTAVNSGVDPSTAFTVASTTVLGALIDLFNKWLGEKKYTVK